MKLKFGNNRHSNTPIGKAGSIASKIGASVFFLIFGCMGTFFAVMFTLSLIRKEADWYLAFFLLVPAVFMFIGFGGLFMTWFGKEKQAKAAKAKNTTSSRFGAILFGLIFVGAGVAGTWFLLIRPLMFTLDATGWTETPCKIVDARVESHSDSDGTTYSVEITYEYEYNGKRHRSDRFRFMNVSSSGCRGKQAFVDKYKQAPNTVCYVDPDNPSEAVLQRNLSLFNLFGLLPLVFIAVGIWIMKSGIKGRFQSRGREWLPAIRDDGMEGSILLKPAFTPLKKLGVAIVFCLFWNGIISIFITEAVRGFTSGQPEWGLTLFMIPFVLVGIGTIVAVVYCALTLLNPKYLLMLMPEQLCPGTPCLIGWKAYGRSSRIQNLSLKLIGREEATYQRGTNTVTDKRNFFEQTLIETTDPGQIAKSETEFTIPADTMHSFEADNNKIVWLFELAGDIHRWPDVKHEYKFIIHPQPMTGEGLS